MSSGIGKELSQEKYGRSKAERDAGSSSETQV